MTPIAIASCILIALGLVAMLALVAVALRSKPGFRRRGGGDNFEGEDRRSSSQSSTVKNNSETTRIDGTIIDMQQKGTK